jgi:hypothetical protein
MVGVELGCLGVIAFYLGARARGGGLAAFVKKAALLAAAAWVAEDTCIRLYGFYAYAEGWHGFVDRVPVLIAMIWPLVVLSAETLARALRPEASAGARAALAGALVVLDAAFIEPAAVRAGLWSWTVPGIFGVPLVGILGWGLFAGAALYAVERLPARAALLALALAPLATHAMLLAAWWGALRWLPRPLPDGAAIAGALVGSAALTWRVLRGDAPRVPMIEMVSRLVAAGFFFVLLAAHAEGAGALALYAAAFAPPHSTRMARVARSRTRLARAAGA